MVDTQPNRTALVTGANRGLGLEIALRLNEHMTTFLGVRKISNFTTRERDLIPYERLIELDVDKQESIDSALDQVLDKTERIDVLVNNAGIYLDDPRKNRYDTILDLPIDAFQDTLNTNLLGPMRLCWKLLPMMKANNYGRVVNVSSGMARFDDFDRYSTFYRVSKLALNGLTRALAEDVRGFNIKINSYCPGWIKTDMGGAAAPRTPSEAAEGVTKLVMLKENGPSGKFFRDSGELSFCEKLR